ncbi:MAG TPA: T9SS type A sorting domain-containing protein, partial [Gillisia sp.]|nr:T9SS type A sorting domain-containing protein [Gillisia sp.]
GDIIRYELYKDSGTTAVASNADGSDFENLGPGVYYVKVFGNDGEETGECEASSDTETIIEPTAISVNVVVNKDESCAGGDGSVSITFSGGTSPYQVSWNGGSYSDATSPYDVNNLSAATYAWKVRDAEGCEMMGSITVNPPENCSHLFPTQTACSDYLYCDRDSFVQEYLCATVKKVKGKDVISNVIPGVFFYYGDFQVAAGDVGKEIVVIVEQVVPTGYTPFSYQNNANVRIFDGCDPLEMTNIRLENGSEAGSYYLKFTFIPIKAGVHVVSVKYDAKSIIGVEDPAGEQSYLFGLRLGENGENKLGGSYGLLGINTDKRCSDPAVFDRGTCNYPKSSILAAETEPVKALSQEIPVDDSSSEIVENGFNVAPVPFRESLSVQYDFDYVSDATIQMFDMQGRLLSTQKEAKASKGKITDLNVNFRVWPSQVYVIKVITDRDVFTKKIISDK